MRLIPSIQKQYFFQKSLYSSQYRFKKKKREYKHPVLALLMCRLNYTSQLLVVELVLIFQTSSTRQHSFYQNKSTVKPKQPIWQFLDICKNFNTIGIGYIHSYGITTHTNLNANTYICSTIYMYCYSKRFEKSCNDLRIYGILEYLVQQ